jgi:8-oxo-dGTP diphosphatase
MKTKEELLEILNNNRITNLNIINFVRDYGFDSIEQEGDSFLIMGTSDRDWIYFSSESAVEFTELMKKLKPGDKCFAGLEDWMLALICRKYDFEWRLSCERLIFPDNIKLNEAKNPMRKLTKADAEYIFKNSKYKQYLTLKYIEDRIQKGINAGIEIDGKLAAWVMSHDDGSIGFLNVLEEYRRKHLGYDITLSAIKMYRERKEIPFVHIEASNIGSINLARKAGFEFDRNIHWIKITMDN